MALSLTVRRPAVAEALATTTLIQVLATGAALALAPIAPAVAHDIGVAPSAIGYQISLIYLAGAFGSAWAGGLIARLGAVRVEQIALLLFAMGMMALALANISAVITGSVLIGLGYGIQNPASAQILGAVSPPHRRNVIFSVKQAGVPLGAVLVSIALPHLDLMLGWRAGIGLLALLPLLLAAYLQMAHPHGDQTVRANRRPARSFLAEQRRVWKNRQWRSLALVCLTFSAVQLSLSAFAGLALLETGRFTMLAAAAAAGLMQLCGAVGRIFWGWCSDRSGTGFGILAVIGLIGTVAMVSVAGLSAMPMMVQVALMCVLGFCLSGWNGVAIAEMTRNCEPADAGPIVGAILLYTFIGVIVGPSLFAIAYAVLHIYGLVFACASLAMFTGAAAASLSFWRTRQE